MDFSVHWTNVYWATALSRALFWVLGTQQWAKHPQHHCLHRACVHSYVGAWWGRVRGKQLSVSVIFCCTTSHPQVEWIKSIATIASVQESAVRAGLSGEGSFWLHVALVGAVRVTAGAGSMHSENKRPLVWKAEKVLLEALKYRTFSLPSTVFQHAIVFLLKKIFLLIF